MKKSYFCISAYIITICALLGFASCKFNAADVKEYLEKYTNSAAVEGITFDGEYPTDSAHRTCLPSDASHYLTLSLRNPQLYDLNFSYTFNNKDVSDYASTLDSPYTFELASDKHSAKLTFSEEFLNYIDMNATGGKDLSGRIFLTEPASGRSFDSYGLSLSANSAPPKVQNPLCQLLGVTGTVGDGTGKYVLCFFTPVTSGTLHTDTTLLSIDSAINSASYTFKSDGKIDSSTDPENRFSYTAPVPGTLLPAVEGGIQFSNISVPEGFQAVYYKTGINYSSDAVTFNVRLSDENGLTSSAIITNKASQLKPPLFNVSSSSANASDEDTGLFALTITHDGACTDDVDAGSGVTINYTVTQTSTGAPVFNGTTTLTGSGLNTASVNLPKGTYTVEATASKDYYITSSIYTASDVTSNPEIGTRTGKITGVRITQPAIFYVAETGDDDENTGASASPYRTIQHALDVFSAGIPNDYPATAICEVRVKTNLTTPDDFWTSTPAPGAMIKIPACPDATVKIKGYGAVRTLASATVPASNTELFQADTTGAKFVLENLKFDSKIDSSNSLKGFRITNGKQNSAVNCEFYNSATIGISLDSGTKLNLTNCKVHNNKESGLRLSGTGTKVAGSDCEIYVNGSSSTQTGGGINVQSGTELDLTGGSIYANQAKYYSTSPAGSGGAISIGASSTVKLTDVTLENNTVNANGGAIYNNGELTLEGCTFSDNCCGSQTTISGLSSPIIYHGAAVYNNGTLNIKGNNQIIANTKDDYTTASNVYLTAEKVITVTGSLTGSSIGVSLEFASDSEPSANAPVAFTSGYGYGTTNTSLPGAIFTAENGYTVALEGTEAAFVVSSGGMYLPTDYNFTFALQDMRRHAASVFEVGKDNALLVRPTITRKKSGETEPVTLYHNSTDTKIYTTTGFTTLAVEDKVGDADFNKVEWAASLYNGPVKVCDTAIEPYNSSDMRITIPSTVTAQDTYTLKVTAKFLGISHDANFTLSGNNVPTGFVQAGDSSGVTFDGTTAITDSNVFISGRTINIPTLYACSHEVTQKEWYDTMGVTQSSILSGGWIYVFGDNNPVFNVSWYMAIAYCNKRSIAEGFTPCYTISGVNWNNLSFSDIPTESNDAWNAVACDFTANGYRLPTEAEWEYLASGGNLTNDGQTTYSGSDNANEVGVFSSLYIQAWGSKNPNALGLYDMSGNVCEWCWDWESYITSETPETGAATGTNRITRGGAKGMSAVSIRSKRMDAPHEQLPNNGFRVVRTVN